MHQLGFRRAFLSWVQRRLPWFSESVIVLPRDPLPAGARGDQVDPEPRLILPPKSDRIAVCVALCAFLGGLFFAIYFFDGAQVFRSLGKVEFLSSRAQAPLRYPLNGNAHDNSRKAETEPASKSWPDVSVNRFFYPSRPFLPPVPGTSGDTLPESFPLPESADSLTQVLLGDGSVAGKVTRKVKSPRANANRRPAVSRRR